MTIRYFRFTTPLVLDAMCQFKADVAAMNKKANDLAADFSGTPLYSHSIHGTHFAGLVFDPPKDSTLWTKPDRKSAGLQRLRTNVPAKHREELETLKARWKSLETTNEASLDAVLKACGTDWGNLLFAKFGYVMTDSAMFIATSLDLSANGEEITGGEFEASSKAAKA